MTDWWQKAYPGGPMVKVPGFPRPLYPPDANQHGKKPSVDGPDVEAYKRTVSRAGRWPWQNFDHAYSNNFAHGSGPNVRQTGVAGIQRQQKIDDSGWLGKATYNTLRSIRIPEGLNHAGEMAMDAYSVELLEEAWDLFGGSEPAPPKGTVRAAALTKAVTQIGYVEGADNATKYGDWYGLNHQPWCAMFMTWCYELAANDTGRDSPAFVRGSRYAYVPYMVGDATLQQNGLRLVTDPEPGDLVAYDWEANGEYDHVGIFETWTYSTSDFNAIEGNTSTSNQSNGGQVMRRARSRGGQPTLFLRATEP